MKVFVVFTSLLVAAIAAPAQLAVLPYNQFIHGGLIAAAPVQTQYHAQDSLGQYQYGYSSGLSAKEEVKSLDGITRGSYSYVDANGELQTVDYTADSVNGFRVAGTNLPKALPAPELVQPMQIEDTNEVAEAKAAHFAAFEEAKTRSSDYRPAQHVYDSKDLPKQVEDTPEVAQAKADHLAAKKQAELQHDGIEEIRATPAPELAQAKLGVYSFLPSFATPTVKLAEPTALPYLRTAYLPHAYHYAPIALNPRFFTRTLAY